MITNKAFNINTTDSVRIPATAPGEKTGRWIVAQYWVKQHGIRAAQDMVEREMGDNIVRKMLTTAKPVIPQDFNPDWIALLQAKSVVRNFATVYPMPNGNMTIPRQRLGSTGAFFSEGTEITVSQLGFDNIQLTWNKYGALTYCSRELLEFTPLNAAGIVANDLTSRLALLEDRTFLTSAGATGVPKGIIHSTATGNVITSSGGTTPTFQTVGYDLQATELALTGNLVTGSFHWIMHPAVVSFFKQLSSSFGVYPFAAEVSGGHLNGFPIHTTTQLATNLGTSGANQTPIILACAEDVIIGDSFRFAISMTTEGSFVDTGTQVNTFGQDLVAFKATSAIDFALKHDVSAAILNANSWALTTVAGIDSYTAQAANTTGSYASSASG